MLTKRIIPCLDVKDGRVVKGIRFKNLVDAGDPAELAATYMDEGADELVLLDISASCERRRTMREWVKKTAERLFIPFTVGGGVCSVEEAREIIEMGSDKISLNTSAVQNPGIITDCARLLGRQAVVVAIDAAKKEPGKWEVYIHGGNTATGTDAVGWAKEAEARGCGEILLTSMDRDGTKDGYDLDLIEAVSSQVGVPVIASGGAGEAGHIAEVFRRGAEAALAASIFHYGTLRIKTLKAELHSQGIPVRRDEE
ncbi:MAG: imidazole glycerol-phosphate synthase subunit HisF [Synergistales bacterium]|nr:imidazole glycerol-phosphate synthase subunit HisF [Synergistales bacterium]